MEDYYAINLKCGWKKLKKYFNKIDETPAYYTATLLNPATKFFCENTWADQPEWIARCNIAFRRLWSQYKDQPIDRSTEPPRSKRIKTSSSLSNHIWANSRRCTTTTQSAQDEFERWFAEDPLDKNHPLAEEPIAYQLQEQSKYPQLSQLALDILTIPASSADCETTFSEAADMLEPC